MSTHEPEEWSAEGLVDHFEHVHRTMQDMRFCFILGAGASVKSGIPAAGRLVARWLDELHRRHGRGRPLAEWATAEALEIPEFDYATATAFYSQVFARRFRQHPEQGYADLEDIMQGKEPSFGYSVLARILAETRHKLVITTNFDNLVADALSIFTATSPLVCGHESLAPFIRVVPRRPVVVKIHRDLLMAPMNRAEEIGALQSPWREPLTRVFSTYTPIVVGYGGNDGSLMGFLKSLPAGAIPGGMFWCYWGPGGPPALEVRELVFQHGGVLVPIEGFDELMLRLSAKLGIPYLDQILEQKSRERIDNYRRSKDELLARVFPPAPPREDVAAPPPVLEAIQDEAEEDADPAAIEAEGREAVPPASSPTEARRPPEAELRPAERTPVPPARSLAAADLGATEAGAPSPLQRRPAPVSASQAERRPPASAPAHHPAPPVRSAVDPAPTTRSASRPEPPARRGHAEPPVPTDSQDDAPPPPPPSRGPDLPTLSSRPAPQVPLLLTSGPFIGSSPTEETVELSKRVAPEAPSSPGLLTLAGDMLLKAMNVTINGSPAHSELQRAMQQLVQGQPDETPFTALIQARAEPDYVRSFELFRAALRRFPGDAGLQIRFAERLSEVPDPSSVREAISVLEDLLQRNPVDARALRHLALLKAWRADFKGATAELRRAWSLAASPPIPDDLALAAFIAGLFARRGSRNDTRFLAILKSAVRDGLPQTVLPRNLVAGLLKNLDDPSRRLYGALDKVLAEGLPLARVESLDSRLAAIAPADLMTLGPDDAP